MKPGASFEVCFFVRFTDNSRCQNMPQMIEEDLTFPGGHLETSISRPSTPTPYLPTPPLSSEELSHPRQSASAAILTSASSTADSRRNHRHPFPSMSSVSTSTSLGAATSQSKLSSDGPLLGAALLSVPQGAEASPSSDISAPAMPFFVRSMPKTLQNPRDHSILEHIYIEMHASRFINLTPLSLLANSLPLYFKGECTDLLIEPKPNVS